MLPKKKFITLTNDGLIPARIQIKYPNSNDFSIEINSKGEYYVIEPQRMFNIKVIFSPTKISKLTFDIKVCLLDNSKSDFTISCSGDGYHEELIFEGSADDDNDVFFTNNVVGRKQTSYFSIKNLSQILSDSIWQIKTCFNFLQKLDIYLRMESK